MARRQVLVQLDDELVTRLDREAKRSNLSRSELIRRAVGSWLEARRLVHLEREQVESYLQMPDDPALAEALLRLAAETAPPYDV